MENYGKLDLKLPKLESWVLNYHRTQAQRSAKTMTAYVSDILRETALNPRRELAKRLEEFRNSLSPPPADAIIETSVEMVRNEREEREQRILPL